MDTHLQRLLVVELTCGVVVALGFGLWQGGPAALAAAYGTFSAMVVAWLLGRSVRHAEKLAASNARQAMVTLYVGALQRFLAVAALIGAGLGWLKLAPLPLIAGFAVAFAGFLLTRPRPAAPSPK